jgi:N-succinyldiaminopimelate aminotransferase
MTAFWDPADEDWIQWNHLVRFAFCKRDDTLDEAISRLARLRDGPAMSTGLNERHP